MENQVDIYSWSLSLIFTTVFDHTENLSNLEHNSNFYTILPIIKQPTAKKKRRKIEYKPVDPVKIAAAKREREKEVKMWDILTEMAAYAFFLWILLVLSYGSRDPNAFLIRASLEQSFIRPRDPWLSFKAVSHSSSGSRQVPLPTDAQPCCQVLMGLTRIA